MITVYEPTENGKLAQCFETAIWGSTVRAIVTLAERYGGVATSHEAAGCCTIIFVNGNVAIYRLA